jgi:hypothetical protein
MSSKEFRDLGECIRNGVLLVAECDCGNKAPIIPMELLKLFSAGTSLTTVRSKLRCTRCHTKGKAILKIAIGEDKAAKRS